MRRPLLQMAIAATALTASAGLAQEFPPAAVVTSEASVRELSPSVDVPGTVTSRFDSRLAAEVEAKLEWIAEVGTRVEKGDVLARLDSDNFSLIEVQAQNQVEREQARVTFLTSEKARLESLAKNNLSARSQLDQTTSNLAVAEADLNIAKAQLGQAKIAMAVTRIRAPFDGMVTERLRNIGERLRTGDEVIRLVDPASLEVVARAPLSTVHFIAEGDVLPLGNDFRDGEAAVRTIVPFGNPQSHMFEVRLDVDAQSWTVGESVRLAMPTANVREVLTVPRDALVLRREGASVFRVLDDSTVEQINVITGLGDGEYIEVIGDVAAGDTVVVRGAERLSTGMKVAAGPSRPGGGGQAAPR